MWHYVTSHYACTAQKRPPLDRLELSFGERARRLSSHGKENSKLNDMVSLRMPLSVTEQIMWVWCQFTKVFSLARQLSWCQSDERNYQSFESSSRQVGKSCCGGWQLRPVSLWWSLCMMKEQAEYGDIFLSKWWNVKLSIYSLSISKKFQNRLLWLLWSSPIRPKNTKERWSVVKTFRHPKTLSCWISAHPASYQSSVQ